MNKYLALSWAGLAGLVGLGFVYLTFERPPVVSTQVGFRGTGMNLVANPRLEPARLAATTTASASPSRRVTESARRALTGSARASPFPSV